MKLKIVKNLTKILALIPCILLIGSNTFFSLSESSNDNLKKTVEEKIIAVDQKELAINTETTKDKKKEKKKNIINKQQIIETPKTFEPISSFSGELTAYIGNCSDGCSGVLACSPRHVVSEKGIYFNDSTFGNVRIVATSSNYPCGSIMKFKVGSSTITAVAMDRGVGGNTVDLLTETTSDAYQIGRRSLKFEVLRLGW